MDLLVLEKRPLLCLEWRGVEKAEEQEEPLDTQSHTGPRPWGLSMSLDVPIFSTTAHPVASSSHHQLQSFCSSFSFFWGEGGLWQGTQESNPS